MHWGHGRDAWMAGRWHSHGPGPRPGRPEWRDFFSDPAPRAERGNVRYLVLDAVAAQPRHGYEIMQAITERSGGSYKPSPGVIYPTLQMLEELKHVRGADDDSRRVYSITDAGKADLEEHRDEVDEFYERASATDAWEDYAEHFGELAARIGKLFKSLRRAARRGRLRPTTVKSLHRVLDEALKKIDEILGDDD